MPTGNATANPATSIAATSSRLAILKTTPPQAASTIALKGAWITSVRNVGCVEQELALRKAQEMLREAEGKVVTVKRWQRDLPQIVKDYEGPARVLSGFLEADMRQALVQLENKIASLEAYMAILPSSMEPATTTSAPAAPAPATVTPPGTTLPSASSVTDTKEP